MMAVVNDAALDVSLAGIERARERIRDFIFLSPCLRSAALTRMTGQEIYLKMDNLQRTGAFKERGALNKLLTLSDDEKRRGVIAASAGNHAQAVA
jgi:threonine dehydratase